MFKWLIKFIKSFLKFKQEEDNKPESFKGSRPVEASSEDVSNDSSDDSEQIGTSEVGDEELAD